jgi:integrase
MPIYKVKGKKDGLQKYNVRINFTSDSGEPKQLTRTTYGLDAAKDLERKLVGDIKVKGENATQKITVQQLYEKYIAARRYEIREATLDTYRRNYERHVQPTMASVRIDKLTVPMLQDWKLAIEQKELSLKSRTHAFGIFRTILNYAVKMEYLAKNPLSNAGNFKDALCVRPEMRIYTAQEFTRYIAIVKRLAEEHEQKHRDLSEWNFYVFFSIAFYTGLRKGEIHALRWSDTNGSLLSVKRSITQKLKGEDRETPPKNRSSIRTLQIPLPLMKVLQEHRARQEQLEHFTPEFRICGGERCLRDSTIQNRNIRYAKLSELHLIRIHDFRHSHVSVLANEGINIQEIARRLGHSRVEMTWNTYSHLYPREEERAVDVLNRIA